MGLAQAFVDGLSVSSILLIAALGLAITFGVMNIINLAHGEFIMIGAYTAYVVATMLEMPFFIALITAFIVTAVVGIIIERLVIRQLYGRPMETLLATVGISIALQQIIRLIFGPGGKSVSNPLPGSITVGEIVIPYFRLFIIVFAICLIIVTLFIMFKTRFGTQLRTISQNRQMSECLGINTSKIDAYTFAFGSGLAGVAGAILAPMKTVAPTMGTEYLMDSFMAVVLGGVGSIIGTSVGSLLIGETQQILSTISTDTLAKIVVFLLIIIVIRYRPEGLFRRERR